METKMADETIIGGESNKAKIGVFWNIDDCPIPGTRVIKPRHIKASIKSALEEEGYLGDVSFWAYSDKPSVVDESYVDYNHAGIIIRNSVGKGVAKLDKMIVDIVLFGLKNRAPSNVWVISKDIAEDQRLLHVLETMNSEHYKILVAQPKSSNSDALRPIISMYWRWPSESDGDDDDLMSDSEDELLCVV